MIVRSSLSASLCAAAIALTCLGSAAGAEARVLSAPLIWEARFSSFKGDTTCAYGAADCNRCAYDIESTFRSMTRDGDYVDSVRSWSWERITQYPPDDRQVNDTLTILPGPVELPVLGSIGPDAQGAHFQGFVRLPTDMSNATPNFAATYGGDAPSLFLGQTGTLDWPTWTVTPDRGRPISDGWLTHLRQTPSTHPGGLTAVGEYVLVPHDGADSELEIVKVSKRDATGFGRRVPLRRDGELATLGAAKLRGGGYLILLRNDKLVHEYWYTPSLERPLLERIYIPPVASPNFPFERGPDNISLTTECNTGDLYATLIGADRAMIEVDELQPNDDVWMLYKASPLKRIDYRTRNTKYFRHWLCDTRAAGSMFVGRHGELAMYCHQKGQDVEELNLYMCSTLAAAAAAGAAAAGGGLLGGVIDAGLGLLGLPPIVTPTLAAVVGTAGAVAGVLGPLAAPLSAVGLYSCIDGLSADRQVGFTEYWPAGGTPEAPASSTAARTITVRIKGMPKGYVHEVTNGKTCSLLSGGESVCRWTVPSGSTVGFVTYYQMQGDDDFGSTDFASGPCVTGTDEAWCTYGTELARCGTRSHSPDVCRFQVTRDVTLTFNAQGGDLL